MKRLILAFLICVSAGLAASGARAQATTNVVPICGTQSYTSGTKQYPTMDTAGNACAVASGAGGGPVTAAANSFASGYSPDLGTLVSPPTGSLLDLTTRLLSAAQSPLASGTNAIGAILPLTSTTTDRGGAITSGGVAQTAIALNASRRNWCIQNDPASTEVLYVRIGGTASATTGTVLQPGWQTCSPTGLIDTAAVSVFAATTSHRWYGFELQ